MIERDSIREHFTHTWWLLLLRGLAGFALGVVAFGWPGFAMRALLIVFGVYALLDGVVAIASGIAAKRGRERWWMIALEGLFGVTTGLIALFYPGLTVLALVFLVAAWAVATGVLEIVLAIRLRKEIRDEWLLAFAGVASIAIGVVMALSPGAGALTLVWMVGVYGLLIGMSFVMLALRVRRMQRTIVDGLEPDARLPNPS